MLNADMDDGCTSPGAVELPPAHVEPTLGRRRHRRITGFSGIVLFACIFLPAVKGCSEPVYPLEMPIFLHPYLYGIVFAIAGTTLTARGMRTVLILLRAIVVLSVLDGIICAFMAPPLGLILLSVAGVLYGAIGFSGASERRIAATAMIVGGGSTIWFGLWAGSPDALVGVYVSLAGAVGLLVGGIVWLAELSLEPASPIVVPRAVARSRE
jgi:hypothetical protein